MKTKPAFQAAATILIVVTITACSAGALPARLFAEPTSTSSPTPAPRITRTTVPSPSPSPEPSITPTYTPRLPQWPRLEVGDTGLLEVFALERLLRYHDFPVIADGRFDEETLAAVRAAQAAWGLPVDGVVRPATWEALVQDLSVRPGDRGEAVRAAQYLLDKFRNPVGIDGVFGPEDVAALQIFETGVGLQPDGVIDAITWQALVAVKPSIEPAMSNP